MDPNSELQILALHRYWMWANRMREKFDEEIQTNTRWIETAKSNPSMISTAFFADDPGIFMSLWYGVLYVVIEGWQELKLVDPTIDVLIRRDEADLLRKYRNGCFHYQKNYFDLRFTNFMAEQNSVEWIRTLTKEFGRYFMDWAEVSKKRV